MKRAGWIALSLVVGAAVFGYRTVCQQQLDQQLLEAVRSNAEDVSVLLQAGANPNTRDTDGTSAVLAAATTRKPEVVSLLAERGANLNLTDVNGGTALHRAAAAGDEAILQVLAEHQASLDLPDRAHRTPLILAVAAGYPQAVRILLEAGADPNEMDGEGQSPLLLAAGAGLLEITTLLLEHGAEVDARDKLGRTALIRALQLPEKGSNPQILEASVASLPSGLPFRRPPQARNSRPLPETPAFSRDLAAVLLKFSPDVTMRDPQGRGVLELAVGRLPAGMVEELRRRGAQSRPETDLLLAAALNQRDAAVQAVARGANVNCRDVSGRSALWWAVCRHSPQLAECLLKQGADANGSAESPLARAIQFGDVGTVRLLLQYGAGRRSANSDPLMILAVKTYNPELVQTLLAAGVDPNEAQRNGTTALYEAVSCSKLSVIQALLDARADVNARLANGILPRTVLGRACLDGRSAVAELLYQRGARLSGEDPAWMERTLDSAAMLRGDARTVGGAPTVRPIGDPDRLLKSAELLLRYRGNEGR